MSEPLDNLSGDAIALQRELRDMRHELAQLRAYVTEVGQNLRFSNWQTMEAVRGMTEDHLLALADRYRDPKCIVKYASQMFSQNSEDGIIAEIFARIGTVDRRFVEVGIDEGGIENNTRFLLLTGWSGVWIEGSAANCAAAGQSGAPFVERGFLKIAQSFITTDNIVATLRDNGVEREFDFLSLDIDMNTHHVWEAMMREYRPRAACIEYNSCFPAPVSFGLPYDPNAVYDGSNYFGASLKYLEELGRQNGYNLVGCDFLGVNAFFVREDCTGDKFRAPFTAENHYEPPRFFLLKHRGHPKTRRTQFGPCAPQKAPVIASRSNLDPSFTVRKA